MKQKFEHPAPSERSLNGPRYWRSLDELADTPGFQDYLKREFPQGAAELDGVDRRHFFKIMAASFALGGLGLAGCRRPEANILPYSKSPENIVPGLPLYFATAFPARGGAVPLLAETHQGRPTKLEGNPSYAPNGGATTLIAQASLLDLYDPDRARVSTRQGKELTGAEINDLLVGLAARFAGNSGAGLAFLAEESTSVARAALLASLKKKFPKSIWSEYEPVSARAPQAGVTAAIGRSAKPLYKFAAAKRVLSLDCDFLQAEPGATQYARDWAKTRRVSEVGDAMSRLYVAESHFTITGSNADHRLRVASSHVPALAAAVAAKVFAATGKFGELAGVLGKVSSGLLADAKWLDACVNDLLENRGSALVIAGSHHAPAVHALVLAVNEALGGVGQTVDLVEVAANEAASINDLAAAIKSGAVQTLVILGGNPAYNAPAELGWSALQKSVPETIRLGGYVDETSAGATVHLHAAHYLESWGDARTIDGTIAPIQPMILPLFGGLTELEVLARLVDGKVVDGYELVHRALIGLAKSEDGFRQFLHLGVLAGSAYEKVSRGVKATAVGGLLEGLPAAPTLSKDKLEVRFTADIKVDDGRHANNGWLQECPEALTKISWDNPIQISPRLAADLGLIDPTRLGPEAAKVVSSAFSPARGRINEFEIGKEQAHVVRLKVGNLVVEGPAHIQPGLANYTIVVPLGYGRTAAGRVGNDVGYSGYAIRTSDSAAFAVGATLEVVAGKGHRLANSQEHWAIEGRDIFREANLEEQLAAVKAGTSWVAGIGMESHSPPIYGHNGDKLSTKAKIVGTPRGNSIYEHPDFKGWAGGDVPHQWGMSIDLNTCIGCNACVVACQAENNIPIVGKDQMLRGREMHWIRLDRYYTSGSTNNEFIPEDPQVAIQPMTCQHCEAAPCENVCPVNATVHDEEGLNVMAYNRCIGTRYCANNCPYKVRRFNYFDWNQRQLDSLYMGPLGPKGMDEMLKMAKNPDVTVRMRGVMEKCTYCVQRIERAKIDQRVRAGASGDITVREGALKTACQQVCPTEAIVFGNLLDENSAVRKAREDKRTYAVLGYLNIRPRTTYLAKVRNPNSHMPDFAKLPLSRVEYENKNHPAHHGSEAHGNAEHTSTGGHH